MLLAPPTPPRSAGGNGTRGKIRNPFTEVANMTKRAMGTLSRARSSNNFSIVPTEASAASLAGTSSTISSPRASRRDIGDSPSRSRDRTFDRHREAIRSALLKAAGTRAKAFQLLDLNGSGILSLTELVDGLRTLKVDWQAITGFRHQRELMLLFDTNKDGVVFLEEMFPDKPMESQPARMDTPEFWGYWCKRNRDCTSTNTESRAPKWSPNTVEDLVQLQTKAHVEREDDSKRRRWISEHYRLLRENGRNTRECREWIAQHLPGATQQERSQVMSFTRSKNVTVSKMRYQEQIFEPVQSIETAVHSLRERRKELQASRKQLWSVVLEPLEKQHEEEEKRRLAADALQGLSALRPRVSNISFGSQHCSLPVCRHSLSPAPWPYGMSADEWPRELARCRLLGSCFLMAVLCFCSVQFQHGYVFTGALRHGTVGDAGTTSMSSSILGMHRHLGCPNGWCGPPRVGKQIAMGALYTPRGGKALQMEWRIAAALVGLIVLVVLLRRLRRARRKKYAWEA